MFKEKNFLSSNPKDLAFIPPHNKNFIFHLIQLPNCLALKTKNLFQIPTDLKENIFKMYWTHVLRHFRIRFFGRQQIPSEIDFVLLQETDVQ